MNDSENTNGFGSRAMEALLLPGSQETERLLNQCTQRILGREWLLECQDDIAIALIRHINDLKQKVVDQDAISTIGIFSSERSMRFRVSAQYKLRDRLDKLVSGEIDYTIGQPDFHQIFFGHKEGEKERLDSVVEEFENLPCQRVSIKGYEI